MKNATDMNYTKITLPKQFAEMPPQAKIDVACTVTQHSPSEYDHLDNGRKAMVAGNLLRGYIRRGGKYTSITATIRKMKAKHN